MNSFLKEFKQFAVRGNAVDLAVGVVIGSAFGAVVSSLVSDIITPILGVLLAQVDFKNLSFTLRDAGINALGQETPAVVLTYGQFIQHSVNFLIVAFAIFLIVKAMNTVRARFDVESAQTTPIKESEDVKLLREIRDLLKK